MTGVMECCDGGLRPEDIAATGHTAE